MNIEQLIEPYIWDAGPEESELQIMVISKGKAIECIKQYAIEAIDEMVKHPDRYWEQDIRGVYANEEAIEALKARINGE